MARAPRQPQSCPPGWLGRYRVATGDNLISIARFFRRSPSQLRKANPHIGNPNQLVPGDVLCVPGNVPYPCGILLKPIEPVPPATEGVAFVHIEPQGGQAITLAAVLPPASHWGNYNQYLAEARVSREAGSFSQRLSQISPATAGWFGTISLPTVVSLLPASCVRILPVNGETGDKGPIILQGQLRNCRRPTIKRKRSRKRCR